MIKKAFDLMEKLRYNFTIYKIMLKYSNQGASRSFAKYEFLYLLPCKFRHYFLLLKNTFFMEECNPHRSEYFSIIL